MTIALVVLVLHESKMYLDRPRFKWVEGFHTLSPDKKWAVHMRTTSTREPASSYIEIFVFDTNVYPELKQDSSPNRYQYQNPKASFLVPVQFSGRIMKGEWELNKNVLKLNQAEIHGLQSINYELDLESFSLYKIQK